MSENIYNIQIKVPDDLNRYFIGDLAIEFVKSYKKEYNEFLTNRLYNYSVVTDTDDIYQKVEFQRKDPNGYIKMKNNDKFLYGDNNNLLFNHIKYGDFSQIQPLVVWFEYIRDREIIVYKYVGYNVESIIKKKYDNKSNILYLYYNQTNGKINMYWVNNINDATKFYYDKVKWNQLGWIKL
jgi:hypothetical protein